MCSQKKRRISKVLINFSINLHKKALAEFWSELFASMEENAGIFSVHHHSLKYSLTGDYTGRTREGA